MARPSPLDHARRAMFGWLTDESSEKWAPSTETDLPVEVQSLIAHRNANSEEAGAIDAVDRSLYPTAEHETDGAVSDTPRI
jgi:60 kDa SS-A/Ro ribonucleoprotein